MMLYDSFLRTGYFLRKRKNTFPLFLVLAMIFALLVTDPSHITPSTVILSMLSVVIAMLSIVIRWMAMRTRGERMPEFIAAKGIYSIVRHPVYISNFLAVLSVSLYLGILWFTVMISFLSVLITERIVYQKENCQYHKYGEDFVTWAKTTGAVVPYVLNWQSAEGSESYLYTARRISPFLLVLSGTFVIISLIKSRILSGVFVLPICWSVVFVLALVVFVLFYNKRFFLRKQ